MFLGRYYSQRGKTRAFRRIQLVPRMRSPLQAVVWIALSCLLNKADAQQSSTEKLTDTPSEDFIDRGQDGSYRFGYKNNDRGEHYHSQSASADNTVSGRYGYRDPAFKRIVQTTYTAGERGFRANGPNIARKMNLGQTKIPYQPPVPQDSPNYRPTYDGYNDPNEDPTYDFNLKSATYSRGESSDAKGSVSGSYSYVDDVGKRHDVLYEADSRNGFNVKSAFPDSDPFPGVFYQGPNKPGTLPRGHTAIVRNNDGSYRFTSSGPDQQRKEVSDSLGRVRGSYTYIDDKGVQRTVQYVAGPNIGYKVIRKGAGPVYSSVYPYARPEFLSPTLNDANIPNVVESSPSSSSSSPSSKGFTASSTVLPPPILDFDRSSSSNRDDFDDDFSKPDSIDNQLLDFPNSPQVPAKPNIVKQSPAARRPTYEVPFAAPTQELNNNRAVAGGGFLPPGAASYLTPPTHEAEKTRPQSGVPNSRPGYPEDLDQQFKKFPNFENNDSRKSYPPSSLPSRPTYAENRPPSGYDYPKPDKNEFFDEGQHPNGKGYSRHVDYQQPHDNYYVDSPQSGSALRAHVQSLDILPYGVKVPSPEEAMNEHHNNY